jgi:tryptophan synthase alpha chain
MSRLKPVFERLKNTPRKALVVYLTAGDPNPHTTVQAALKAVEQGADVLEIGVPFSDPVADGPVIQRAMERSLAQGGGFEQALQVVRQIREVSQVPMVVFGYANPLFYHGVEKACEQLADAGADGLLVVDIPYEESSHMRQAAVKCGLDWVALVAPTSGVARAKAIASCATGFVYMVSMTGVTGGNVGSLDPVKPLIAAIQEVSNVPVCIGFGVRDFDSAQKVASVCDGVVVGSAVVAALQKDQGNSSPLSSVAHLIQQLRAGVDAAT